MTAVTIHLPTETERTLREKASSSGVTLEVYLRRLAEREATNGSPKKETLDDILAPVRQGFAESGMTDDELDTLFRETRDKVRREKE